MEIYFVTVNSISFSRVKELVREHFTDYEIWWSPEGDEIQLRKEDSGLIWFTYGDMDDKVGREIELDQYRSSEVLDDDFASKLEGADFFYCNYDLFIDMREFMMRLLSYLKEDLRDIWITNNFWNIISGPAFLYYLESDENWSWYQDFGVNGNVPDPTEITSND